MKRRSKSWYKPLSLMLLAGVLTLAGCSGDDGAPGLNGRNGVDGVDGQDGAPAVTQALAFLPQPDVTIDSVTVNTTDPANPTIMTRFTIADDSMYAGGIEAIDPSNTSRFLYLRFAYARLKPADAATGNTAQWIRYTSGDRDPSHLTDNGNGTFTMATPVAAADFDATMPTRALIMIAGVDNVAAPLNVIHNFVPNGGAVTVSRDVVSEDACNDCHGNLGGGTNGISGIHGGSRYLVAGCVVCHADRTNSASGTQGISVGREFAYMVHAIHAAVNLLDTPDVIPGRDDWSEITYPENIKNCVKCHRNNDDATVVAEAGNWQDAPSMQACRSCHFTIVFDGVTPYTGLDGVVKTHSLQSNNTQCSICHPATGAGVGRSIAVAHDTTLTGLNAPEFDVTITMTAPANGTHYVAGETPLVTVTLADHATGTPVAGTVYTADQDVEGAAGTAEGLSLASLYVYGPRNEAVPVLTTGSTTDTVTPATPPTQAHPLFVNELVGGVPTANDDPLVGTTASGFSYQLMDVTGLVPGTYMVRFEGADYGAIDDVDYRTSSSAVVTFQVGTATVEPKVSGDGCLNCHGNTIMHLEGAHPHHAPFDTDHCLGCHDKSGNYADYIGNRVHAVHGATVTGDLYVSTTTLTPRDWSEVTFPQPANNCTICHTNPNAETPVWRTPDEVVCGGCHGANPAADPDNPNFYTGLTPTQMAAKLEKIRMEIAAAQHMETNGGDFDPITPATLQCLVCHGEGRVADLFVTHKLITFPPIVPED